MGWTKQQFILQAFDELGFGSDAYSIGTDQLNLALIKLEAMMGRWAGKGVHVRYPIAADIDSASLSTTTNVPDAANEAIYKNLAVKLAPSLGKAVSQLLNKEAIDTYKDLVSFADSEELPVMQMPGYVPLGAGNRRRFGTDQNFVDSPDERPLYTDDSGKLKFRS